jgi:hypothetical protein
MDYNLTNKAIKITVLNFPINPMLFITNFADSN